MVKALINIDDHTNRIINIVKAQHGLKDKSQVIDFIAIRYEEEILEPELRPVKEGKDEAVKKLEAIIGILSEEEAQEMEKHIKEIRKTGRS